MTRILRFEKFPLSRPGLGQIDEYRADSMQSDAPPLRPIQQHLSPIENFTVQIARSGQTFGASLAGAVGITNLHGKAVHLQA